MPSFDEVGPVKDDKRRVVSIFYITWHSEDHFANFTNPYSADVSKILKADPMHGWMQIIRFGKKDPIIGENRKWVIFSARTNM